MLYLLNIHPRPEDVPDFINNLLIYLVIQR